jgi:GMP synthase-like glutamine amidotransferase
MRVGQHAYGIQFHVEVTAETVPQWSAVPEYEAALEKVLGAGTAATLARETEARLPAFARDARTLYDNFMGMLRARPVS